MNKLTRRRFLIASGVTAAGALAAGATQVWVTPNDRITDEHWASVVRRLVSR